MPSNLCSVCNLDNCELQLQGCGCFLHVTCCSLSLILDAGTKTPEATLPVGPVNTQSLVCGICGSGPVTGVRMLPLSFEPLEKAVKLRLAASSRHNSSHSAKSSSEVPPVSGQKRTRDDDLSEREIETAQFVFSMGKRTLATNKSDSDTQRTGRWGHEEIAFVEYLVKSFDHGQLPIAHGTKLSAFLGDLLLCKASRLTKKMKNAKLARSFELAVPGGTTPTDFRHDGSVVNKLQRDFIQSLANEYAQLENGFHLSKHWRSCFSELCLQVGYPFLDASLYLASLDDYERQSSLAEEHMRNVRRKRMGLSIKSGAHSSRASSMPQPVGGVSAVVPNGSTVSTSEPTLDPVEKVNDVLSELGVPSKDEIHLDSTSLDYLDSSLIDFIADPSTAGEEESKDMMMGVPYDNKFDAYLPAVRHTRGPFLEAIATYLEQHNLPFQHADAWVPSFVEGTNDEVQLFHAGSVTRRDIKDDKVWSALENFGEYSKGITFTPGVGIVGRVYSSGETEWECDVNELDPKVFLRAGGAKEYGVRTATGVPFSTPGVGRMVVVLYSCNHVQEDAAMVNKCAEDLSRFTIEPKWKLVIEIGDQSASPPPAAREVAPSNHGQTTVEDKFTKSLPERMNPTRKASGEIISLFGEQLALHSRSLSLSDESSTTNVDSSALFRELMSIRLMLLRPEHRRSSEENEAIDLLKCSYKAHCSAGNVQSGAELATLLTREWLYLTGSSQPSFASTTCSIHHHPKVDHAVDDVLKTAVKPLGSHSATEFEAIQQLPSNQTKVGTTIRSTDKSLEHLADVHTTDIGKIFPDQSGHQTLPTREGSSIRRTVSSGTLDHLSTVGGTITDSPKA